MRLVKERAGWSGEGAVGCLVDDPEPGGLIQDRAEGGDEGGQVEVLRDGGQLDDELIPAEVDVGVGLGNQPDRHLGELDG